MFVKLFSTLTAAAVALTLGASPATAAFDSEHQLLLDAVIDAGVKVYVNPQQCYKNPGLSGFYIGQSSVLAICQDNKREVGEQVAEWTDNDLDTLRHESHHLVQDCIGTRGDNILDPMFVDNLEGFLRNSSLTEADVIGIMGTYLRRGADTDTVELELEAFAVAADIPASGIAEGVRRFCNK